MTTVHCRSCGAPLTLTVCDLGLSPISNAFIRLDDLSHGEMFYPLETRVCEACWLVQIATELPSTAHFHDDYVYFSSFSTSWVEHARRYSELVTARFELGRASRVIEIASNDGYLLQHFVSAGIPSLGIEPTANTAAAARDKGIETRELFFGRQTAAALAADGWRADLIAANNVLAHDPDINAFIGGIPLALKPGGVATFEFPHLLNLIELNQFDTIYHEHYCYLSLTALQPVFQRARLRVFDVESLPTHGGSLRLYVCHAAAGHAESPAVAATLAAEQTAGLTSAERYREFAAGVTRTRSELLGFLIEAGRAGKRLAAYGAAAKGNTLLNYCGVRTDMVQFVADKNPTKQGRYLPGARIPVVGPEAIESRKPDFVLILPWNIKDEIIAQLGGIRAWGGQFVVPIPRLEIIP
jgi:SAM-dependent methyltransferase